MVDDLSGARMLACTFSNTEMDMLPMTIVDDALEPLPGVAPYAHPNPDYGVRDPSLTKRNGYYYMCATRPLKSDYLGESTHVQIAVSDDLIRWQHLTDVPADVSGVNRCWAPEFFTDTDGTVWMLYAVSTDGGSSFVMHARRMLNDALTSWDTPAVMQGLTDPTIDTYVVHDGGTYWAFCKDESARRLYLATADSVTGPYTIVEQPGWIGNTSATEGPQVVPLPGGRWRLYYDRYADNQLCYRESDGDLRVWGPEQHLQYDTSRDLRHLGPLWLSPGEWAAFNTHQRRATAWNSGAQSVHSETITPLAFGDATGDTAMWAAAHPTRLYAAKDGLHSITAEVAWSPNGSGQRSIGYVKSSGGTAWASSQNATGGGFGTEQSFVAGGVWLTSGEYIEIFGFHNLGSPLDVGSCAATLSRER